MSDPAVVAAQRAWVEPDGGPAYYRTMTDAMNAAAREMAKSVQELLAEARKWKPYSTHDIGEAQKLIGDKIRENLPAVHQRASQSNPRRDWHRVPLGIWLDRGDRMSVFVVAAYVIAGVSLVSVGLFLAATFVVGVMELIQWLLDGAPPFDD